MRIWIDECMTAQTEMPTPLDFSSFWLRIKTAVIDRRRLDGNTGTLSSAWVLPCKTHHGGDG